MDNDMYRSWRRRQKEKANRFNNWPRRGFGLVKELKDWFRSRALRAENAGHFGTRKGPIVEGEYNIISRTFCFQAHKKAARSHLLGIYHRSAEATPSRIKRENVYINAFH